MIINAKITGIKYTPLLCDVLQTFGESDFETALETNAVFLYTTCGKTIAVSKWELLK